MLVGYACSSNKTPIDEEKVDLAISNLRNGFAFVGTFSAVHRFGAVAVLLCVNHDTVADNGVRFFSW